MEKWITADELAEVSGKTKRGIYKNKSIPYRQDGGAREYDFNSAEIQNWLNPKPKIKGVKPVKVKAVKKVAEKKVKPKTVKAAPAAVKPKSQAKPEPPRDPFEIPDHLKNIADSGQLTFEMAMSMSKTDLDKIKIYEQIKKTKVEAEVKRQDYIAKGLVKTLMHKLYEIDRNQLIPMKDRLVIDLSAIFKIDDDKLKVKAAEKLDEEFWGYLGSVKSEMNKFLKRHKGDEI